MEAQRDADALLGRLVDSIAAIPDPIERAHECLRIGDDVRGLQARLGDVRRRAIYEATLKPGATGRSVAHDLRVSAKTVSLASGEFRRDDLELLHRLVDAVRPLIAEDAVDHADAMLASSTAVGVIAHVVAQLAPQWRQATVGVDGEDDAWWEVHADFERAEYLSALAGLHREPRSRTPSAVIDERTPARLRWPRRVLDAMPGIHASASTTDEPHATVWTLWWNIESADHHLDIADVGPSPQGWLVSEWLVWLARDYRMAGQAVASRVTAPPPMLNHPGGMLSFAIEADLDGSNAVDPHEFARSIVLLWSGDGDKVDASGYFDIDWPSEDAA